MTKFSKTESWPEKRTLLFADGDKEVLKHLLSSKLPGSVYAMRPKKKGETLRYAVFKKPCYMKMIKDFLPAIERTQFPDIKEDIVSLENLKIPKKKVIIKKKSNIDTSQQTHNDQIEDTMIGEANSDPSQQAQLFSENDNSITKGSYGRPSQTKPFLSRTYQNEKFPKNRTNAMTRGRGSYRRPFQRKQFLSRTSQNEIPRNVNEVTRSGPFERKPEITRSGPFERKPEITRSGPFERKPEITRSGPFKRKPFLSRTYQNQIGKSPFMKYGVHDTNAFRWLKCLRVPYKQQVEEKFVRDRSAINSIYKMISNCYSIYGTYLKQKVEENEGLICAMDPIRECQFDKNMVLLLAIGKDETNKFVVGLDRKSNILEPLSMVVHNYADHIVKFTEVFQMFLENSTYADTFLNKLIVHTNLSKEIMLTVIVYNIKSFIDMKQKLISDLKEFFEQGEGKECCVTALYFRLCSRYHVSDQDSDLIMGSPIEDEVVGLKLHLSPGKMLWTSLYGAEMLCKAIEELLIPTKELSILEVGCNSGFIGLYLSKLVGEVLSIGSDTAVKLAEKNRELNNITNCTYFNGDYWRSIIRAAENIKLDTVYAIFIKSVIDKCDYRKLLTELRMIKKLQKILLVIDMSMDSPSNLVLSLSDPDTSQDKGNPFLPVRALPVDTMPNSNGHILLLLMERFNIDTLNSTTSVELNNTTSMELNNTTSMELNNTTSMELNNTTSMELNNTTSMELNNASVE